ncbi:hypothetical protein ACFUIT_39965 [Streptomyces sp. NPDC057239]|uniref:hypothetical protein n=1 Tax=Streptomyces sp. NPDC057239 TaxID=3346061 RepID=UPI00362E2F48
MRKKRMGDDAADSVVSPPAFPFGKIRTTLFTAELGVLAAPHVGGETIPYVEPAAPYALSGMAVTVAWPHITWLAKRTARSCGALCGKAVDKVFKGIQNRWDRVRAEKQDSESSGGPGTQETGPQTTSAPEAPAAAPLRPLYGIPPQTTFTEPPVGSLPVGEADEE